MIAFVHFDYFSINKKVIVLFMVALPLLTFGQTRRIINTGYWHETTTWENGNIANSLTHNVEMNNNRSVTINNNQYTVGNLMMGNNNSLTVSSGGSLILGGPSPGDTIRFITNNGSNITVHGDLYIYGDLVINNNLVLIVTGTLYVSGDIELKNGASIAVEGVMDIDGSFKAGSNTTLQIDGSVNVEGDFYIGDNSAATGSGTIKYNGTCYDDGSGICGSSVLPVTLLYFKALVSENSISLSWATAKEENFNKFELQRSNNAKDFYAIATIKGSGNTFDVVKYSYEDCNPFYGTVYYRLKAVDLDGTFEYFPIISAGFQGGNLEKAVISPNPFNGYSFSLTAAEAKHGPNEIFITDLFGNEVFRSGFSSGINHFYLESRLSSGLYIATLKSGPHIKKIKLIVR